MEDFTGGGYNPSHRRLEDWGNLGIKWPPFCLVTFLPSLISSPPEARSDDEKSEGNRNEVRSGVGWTAVGLGSVPRRRARWREWKTRVKPSPKVRWEWASSRVTLFALRSLSTRYACDLPSVGPLRGVYDKGRIITFWLTVTFLLLWPSFTPYSHFTGYLFPSLSCTRRRPGPGWNEVRGERKCNRHPGPLRRVPRPFVPRYRRWWSGTETPRNREERGMMTQDEDALHLPSCLLTLLSFLLKDSSSCVVYRRVAFTPVGRSLPAAPRR